MIELFPTMCVSSVNGTGEGAHSRCLAYDHEPGSQTPASLLRLKKNGHVNIRLTNFLYLLNKQTHQPTGRPIGH